MSFSTGYLLNIGRAYFAGGLLRPASSDGWKIRQTAQSTNGEQVIIYIYIFKRNSACKTQRLAGHNLKLPQWVMHSRIECGIVLKSPLNYSKMIC